MSESNNDSKKIIYFDYLRFVSILLIVLIHVLSLVIHRFGEVNLRVWFYANFIDSFIRFSVPIFFMISCAINLSPDKPYNLKKRIISLIVPTVVFSIIYLIYDNKILSFSFPEIFLEISKGHVYYHLWFVYIMFGLYLLTPLIRSAISKEDNIKLFLIIWAIYSVLLPFLGIFIDLNVYGSLNLFGGYIGLYLLGYYLSRKNVDTNKRNLKVILYFAAFFLASAFLAIGYFNMSLSDGSANTVFYYHYLNPFIVISSLSVFKIFQLFFYDHKEENVVVKYVTKISFYIYIVHALVLSYVVRFLPLNLNSTFRTFKDLLVIYTICLVVSVFISWLSYLILNPLVNITTRFYRFFTVLFVGILLIALIPKVYKLIPSFYNSTKHNLSYLRNKSENFFIGKNFTHKEYLPKNHNLILKIQEPSNIRVAIPVDMLSHISNSNKCVLYITDESRSNREDLSIKHISSPDGDIYGFSDEDVWEQLVCTDVTEIDMYFNKIGNIFIQKL